MIQPIVVRAAGSIIGIALFGIGPAVSQSSLLSALEGSAPAPVLDQTTHAITRGLAALWVDPTIDPRAKGLMFSVTQNSYASVEAFHGIVAFTLGPRWSIGYGSTRLGTLFDSSLTNQDPSLLGLRAQSGWGRLDGTLRARSVTTSVGVGWAIDDNVGVVHSATIARAHARIAPWKSTNLSVGFQHSQSIGGSVPSGKGQQGFDVTFRQPLRQYSFSITVGMRRGELWKSSETTSGYGLGALVEFLDQMNVSAALGRYRMAYGSSLVESYRSFGASMRIGTIRFSARYSNTYIGLGSGFAGSVAYEPRQATQRTKLASLSR